MRNVWFRHKFIGCARRNFGGRPLLCVVFGLRWQRSIRFPLCPEVGCSPQFHPSFILSSTCLQHKVALLHNTPPFIPSIFLASLCSCFRLFNYAVPTCHLEQHPPLGSSLWTTVPKQTASGAGVCGQETQARKTEPTVCIECVYISG